MGKSQSSYEQSNANGLKVNRAPGDRFQRGEQASGAGDLHLIQEQIALAYFLECWCSRVL